MGFLACDPHTHPTHTLNSGDDADGFAQTLQLGSLLDMGFDEGGHRKADRPACGAGSRRDSGVQDVTDLHAGAVGDGDDLVQPPHAAERLGAHHAGRKARTFLV